MKETIWGLLIPFAGTVAGAACVFCMKRALSTHAQRAMTGFAAGVMVAASVWSLLIPSMELSAHLAKWAFAPAAAGFLAGVAFLLLLDHVTPHCTGIPTGRRGRRAASTARRKWCSR